MLWEYICSRPAILGRAHRRNYFRQQYLQAARGLHFYVPRRKIGFQAENEADQKNIEDWPAYNKLLSEGHIVFDTLGVLRYKHGAPVGELIFVKLRKDGTPIYKESAAEWFDPNSPKAEEFQWPK